MVCFADEQDGSTLSDSGLLPLLRNDYGCAIHSWVFMTTTIFIYSRDTHGAHDSIGLMMQALDSERYVALTQYRHSPPRHFMGRPLSLPAW